MSVNVKTTSIEFEIGEQKITVTLEEAKALHSELEKLFGSKTVMMPTLPTQPRDYEPWRKTTPYFTGTGDFVSTCENGVTLSNTKIVPLADIGGGSSNKGVA